MKNHKNTSMIKKIFAFAFVLALLMTAFSVVALADDGIVLKSFNGNEIVRQIVSYLGGIIAVTGSIAGVIFIFIGKITDDQKQLVRGIIAILMALGCGGLLLLIVNALLV